MTLNMMPQTAISLSISGLIFATSLLIGCNGNTSSSDGQDAKISSEGEGETEGEGEGAEGEGAEGEGAEGEGAEGEGEGPLFGCDGAAPCAVDADCAPYLDSFPWNDPTQVHCYPEECLCSECGQDGDCGGGEWMCQGRVGGVRCIGRPHCVSDDECMVGGYEDRHYLCINQRCFPCNDERHCPGDEVCRIGYCFFEGN